MKDLLLHSRRVLLSATEVPAPATVHIRDGKIIAMDESGSPPGHLSVTDFGDLVLMPGIVDTHAHINEPGRTDWEGFRTACRAAASGGITTVIDMPLNSIPPTTTLGNLKAKSKAAKDQCLIDYGFWGGVIPGNADALEPMIDAGVFGFKAFLIDSGVPEFPMVTEKDLRPAMRILSRRKVPLLVHAEVCPHSETNTIDRTYQSYLQSRPPQWEIEAIRMMIRLVRETQCPVHIVHLSAASALDDIAQAKAEGLPITVETCPHYLTFEAENIPDGATHFKCAPPIRDHTNRQKLWQGLLSRQIDMIVSDHSPCTPNLKELQSGNFDMAWGGIAGLQFGLSAVWTEMKARNIPIQFLLRWMCHGPSQLAQLGHRKGALAVGMDADLVLWNPEESFVLYPKDIRHRHNVTPYAGLSFFGKVEKTFLRGICVFDRGEIPDMSVGQEVSLDSKRTAFTELVDLASKRVGAKVLSASDDFFAPKENLIKPTRAIFLPDKYTERGKWMDGWETRRKRTAGHDWCVVKLGLAGQICGVNVDTSHFLGNFPEYCSIEASSTAAGKIAKWTEILPKSPLRGGTDNLFPISDTNRWTHLRLNIYPDGGVARLHVHGIVLPDWKKLPQKEVDLAAVENGGTVVSCNDSFFGPKDNLIMPGESTHMGDGWETRRRRRPGNDWIIVKLGKAGKIKKLLIDTSHFKGNFPDMCSVEGSQSDTLNTWSEILPKTKLKAHFKHPFSKELKNLNASYRYLRLQIYPDGGIARFRVYGIFDA